MSKQNVLKELGERIRNERKAQGFSQEGFAHVANLDRSYYGSIERGERNITFYTICEIAEKLNRDVGYSSYQVREITAHYGKIIDGH